MFSDILLFTFALFVTGCLLFIVIYFLITLSDLECDYLNAQECCGRLNFVSSASKFFKHPTNLNPSFFCFFQWNVPKLWLQLTIQLLLLIMGHWILFCFNLPICVFLSRR
jgi:ABC-type phosphate/phosphonate transport system permease subunit